VEYLQEIQFERLTRELDEVHLTVADQLHQCRVQLSEKMVSVSRWVLCALCRSSFVDIELLHPLCY